jgi:hypothetical protein
MDKIISDYIKKCLPKLIKEARLYYDKNVPNYIPDAEDVTEDVCDVIEEKIGLYINKEQYEVILKIVEGE